MNRVIPLTKHHALGNDFLVIVDPDDRWGIRPVEAKVLCDRRRGIGADGVMRATWDAEQNEVRMELYNADGSEAEMSGNGIRCFAQAVLDAGMVDDHRFTVQTAAGQRRVSVNLSHGLSEVEVEVWMGNPEFLGEAEEVVSDGHRWLGRSVSVGNPHLVLVVDSADHLAGLDLDVIGRPLSEARGVNVEWIAATDPSVLSLRVWERGADETQACGTGSVAAAFAAQAWGMVGNVTEVKNPGGTLRIELADDGAYLEGSAVLVARVEIDTEWLETEVDRAVLT